MLNRRFLKVILLFFLAAMGVILYADTQSVHQIYRISQATINSAADAQTRQSLIADRDKRDREERRHKMAIEGALTVDMFLFAWLTVVTLRRGKHQNTAN